MKPVARRPHHRTRARKQQRANSKLQRQQALPPGHPAGFPYPPPYPTTYYYPYPYPPYQYPHVGPPNLTPTVTPDATSTVPPLKNKNAKPQQIQKKAPKIVSVSSSTPDAAPSEDAKDTAKETEGIVVPHENDVLMGRGGKNNTHVGNERLREMARAMRPVYIKSRKKDKTNMARQLVQQVYSLNPPGRFLQRDPVTMIWEEVDLDTARHKTSQCLRDAASEKPSAARKKTEETLQIDPVAIEKIIAVGEEAVKKSRAMTPVVSNLAHKIEPSPPLVHESLDGARNRLENWESSLARNLIESWDDKTGSFARGLSRRGSMGSTSSNQHYHHNYGARQSMYTWQSSSNSTNMDVEEVEDAVLIPPEELNGEGDESFSLLDVSQFDDEMETQIWQPDKHDESESPFDTEFFY